MSFPKPHPAGPPNAFTVQDDDGDILNDLYTFATIEAASEFVRDLTRRPGLRAPLIVACWAYVDIEGRIGPYVGRGTVPLNYGPGMADYGRVSWAA
jgi:hypothetical protein